MKTELKAKFLQHILNKKKDESGFTLIELLVVIIIIGILSAIALPSFLNQANKAKQSEAKTYVGALNKGQQAFFTEKSTFGTAANLLGIGINTSTVNYDYESTGGLTRADSTGDSKVAVLRSYSGAVQIQGVGGGSNDVTSVAILCENDVPGAVPGIAPTSGTQCGAASTQVGG
ncbi:MULTISPECIES: type IV pilin-like G/H family protein [unclassified Nodularia (in: cyanobacteria)]|uniref:type IV pilin-like G/H family protein n=1 Tax=unclassified Nodularia (in: cyanobacteria) TaxID=2656917 RepID=UPI00187F35C3|nr:MULTISPECIES: type IV pilin-like G/H family protein [unclassified Nodularia (in: cyanobacteria)]MBE9198233.1 type IV pilin-like G/H family protein [Nodularia sp. LEGE 06071]MCC2694861.1 type IV pilin-like G/H family protein [Nodularia sp. LEGE 04288]